MNEWSLADVLYYAVFGVAVPLCTFGYGLYFFVVDKRIANKGICIEGQVCEIIKEWDFRNTKYRAKITYTLDNKAYTTILLLDTDEMLLYRPGDEVTLRCLPDNPIHVRLSTHKLMRKGRWWMIGSFLFLLFCFLVFIQ